MGRNADSWIWERRREGQVEGSGLVGMASQQMDLAFRSEGRSDTTSIWRRFTSDTTGSKLEVGVWGLPSSLQG